MSNALLPAILDWKIAACFDTSKIRAISTAEMVPKKLNKRPLFMRLRLLDYCRGLAKDSWSPWQEKGKRTGGLA